MSLENVFKKEIHMRRQEFIEQLRIALQGTIPQEKLNEHLRYYDNYIMEEARKGRTEEQVIEDLGDPRLIAKTLAMTDTSGNHNGTDHQRQKKQKSSFRWNSWYGRALLIIIAILIVIIVGHVLAFLLPIVLTVVLVLVVLSFFLGKRK